ncbi:MAG: phosphoribosylamine--glycine ligase [Chloroflexi bacterium]|nr:phosphoribosylamine--glycine ligase [Chloroflexota bacterium]MDA1241053.1 phosphoribosylamine--glycine ligase [Chloroflexota bacterium]
MNVLLIGSGGREHAIAWKIAQSPLLSKLWCAPGNAGMAEFGEVVPEVGATDTQAIRALAERIRADLVVVSSDDPLAAGVVDAVQAADITAFGATRAAAELEWSKSFANDLMARAAIDTAANRTFTDPDEATAYARSLGGPCVVKADGLAAGKGVTVCDTTEQAVAAIDAALRDGTFGASGSRVVIVERMYGREVSAHAFTDGVTVRHMPFSCDHKAIFDGNVGPNTGGMGVYAPPAWLTDAQAEAIRREVTERAVSAMAGIGRPFSGVIYPGVMVTATGPRVFEYNGRFGDPETQVLLPTLQSDLLAIFDACAHGRLAEVPVEWSGAASVGVVMASEGYPGPSPSGRPITGLDAVDADVQVFLAGAKREDSARLVTSGGRVLCVVAQGATMEEARAQAYDNVRRIHFAGAQYRTDIGATASEPLVFAAR